MALIVNNISEAATAIRSGGVVAYPTESCFGLGCDPLNTDAIARILLMKQRERAKGVILIADAFEKFSDYLLPINEVIMERLRESWPGPYTWLCPCKPEVSDWLRGEHDTLAVRVTGHATAKQLSALAEMAIVSTSANVATHPALKTTEQVIAEFGNLVDAIVDAPIGADQSPSTIAFAESGNVVR